MNIELSQISPYLPYKLLCQYEGIINGKELAEQEKAFKADGNPFDWNVQPVKGLKIAPVKELRIFKDYWKVYIGNYRNGLKSFINGHEFKPLLRPMSDLFNDRLNPIPINELQMKYGWDYLFYDVYKKKKEFNVNELKHACLIKLFEWHFDVFGLIDAGLAINKLDN